VFEGGDLDAARHDAVGAARAAGVDTGALDRILGVLPGLVQDAASGFQRSVGEQHHLEDLLRDANAQLVDLNRNYQLLIRKLERLLADKETLTEKLERANQRLAQIASTDGLTGLFNHRTFQEGLRRDLHRAERTARPLSLLLLDVDHFKTFNDSYGHPAGDAVLRAIGKLLLASVRVGDVAARYGGEEFVLILPDTDAKGAELLAERLRANVAKMRVKIGEDSIRVTASFGVATASGRCRDVGGELVARADAALYEAKRAGRNCVRSSGVLEPPAAVASGS
jgi:diguanylate cyclase (GGDEF)-like protein